LNSLVAPHLIQSEKVRIGRSTVMRISREYLVTAVASFLFVSLVLTLPVKAGDMKPFVGKGEQLYAEFVGSLEALEDPRLSEIVSSYDDTGALVTLYAIRYVDEINNVGGKSTSIAKEVIYVYPAKPADWFMTEVTATANGDEIYRELSGIAYPIAGPGSDLVILGGWEVTGGTGRFENAVGYGEIHGFVDPSGTNLSVIFEGKISTVGSRRRSR
jgi:hypothetical protein